MKNDLTDIANNIPIHTVSYLTDDRDTENRLVLHITLGGNGDWYVATCPEGVNPARAVRICTSGGAASAAPGLGVGIAQAFNALLAATRPPKLQPPHYVNVALEPDHEPDYMEVVSHTLAATGEGYVWEENPAYHLALYELGPDGVIRRRDDPKKDNA